MNPALRGLSQDIRSQRTVTLHIRFRRIGSRRRQRRHLEWRVLRVDSRLWRYPFVNVEPMSVQWPPSLLGVCPTSADDARGDARVARPWRVVGRAAAISPDGGPLLRYSFHSAEGSTAAGDESLGVESRDVLHGRAAESRVVPAGQRGFYAEESTARWLAMSRNLDDIRHHTIGLHRGA